MTTQPQNNPNRLAPFGIEIAHSLSEAAETLPEQSASKTIAGFAAQGNREGVIAITSAAAEIGKVVKVTRETEEGTWDIEDLFTADQLFAMAGRIHDYLGTNIETHLDELAAPPGYPHYVGRLAMHFASGDRGVTSNFGAFERSHSNPSDAARGPRERNSREYANWANEEMLRQFDSFYQADLQVRLTGPTKTVEGSRVSWERGIAECQFLVLDYIRDQLAAGHSSATATGETVSMSVEDIGHNLATLLTDHQRLTTEIATINPLLAEQVDFALGHLAEFTTEVFHRGRMGTLRFRKEPDAARRAIQRVETLLVHAASLAETREDQAEIPILYL